MKRICRTILGIAVAVSPAVAKADIFVNGKGALPTGVFTQASQQPDQDNPKPKPKPWKFGPRVGASMICATSTRMATTTTWWTPFIQAINSLSSSWKADAANDLAPGRFKTRAHRDPNAVPS